MNHDHCQVHAVPRASVGVGPTLCGLGITVAALQASGISHLHTTSRLLDVTCQACRREVDPHGLKDVARFDKDTTYFRWYCLCGSVGGRSASEQAARAAHAVHEQDHQ